MGSHDFVKFPPNLGEFTPRTWLLLGEIQAKIEHLRLLPIPPEDSESLRQIYLAKSVHGTTAIEGNSYSEEEVAKIINKELQAPPSLAYQKQQIDNMVAAFNLVFSFHAGGKTREVSLDLLHTYHRHVLNNLEDSLSDTIHIGEFRQHRVTVGRYLAVPPEQVTQLMAQFCDWLNDQAEGIRGYRVAAQIVKAIVAHVYFAWIHPYGDGNGRMARLVEFAVMVHASIPDVAAHLLSNFYNKTRDQYYRHLQESHGEYRDGAYSAEGNLQGFIDYALQGFKDELDDQLKAIYELQTRAIWHEVIHAVFRKRFSENLSAAQQRQKRLVLDLTAHHFEKPVRKSEIPDISSALARAYRDKSDRTIQRDLNELEKLGFLQRAEPGYKPNTDVLMAFFAKSPHNDD